MNRARRREKWCIKEEDEAVLMGVSSSPLGLYGIYTVYMAISRFGRLMILLETTASLRWCIFVVVRGVVVRLLLRVVL